MCPSNTPRSNFFAVPISHQKKRVERPEYEPGGEHEKQPEADRREGARIETKPPASAATSAAKHHRRAGRVTSPASPSSARRQRAYCWRSSLQANPNPMADERPGTSVNLRLAEPCPAAASVQQGLRYGCRNQKPRACLHRCCCGARCYCCAASFPHGHCLSRKTLRECRCVCEVCRQHRQGQSKAGERASVCTAEIGTTPDAGGTEILDPPPKFIVINITPPPVAVGLFQQPAQAT